MLVLDSGGVSRLAAANGTSLAIIRSLRDAGLWPPIVPTVVLVEALRGDPQRDVKTNPFLKACLIEPAVPVLLARRAAELRRSARRGSAVDALVVAMAEPGGTVLTGDTADIAALAAHANGVAVERI